MLMIFGVIIYCIAIYGVLTTIYIVDKVIKFTV